jgi:intraflagellar transport protein 172
VQVDEAVRTLQKQTGPTTEASVSMYKRLAKRILSRTASEEAASDQPAIVAALKEVLYRLANLFRGQSSGRQLNPDIEEILMATHYQHMFFVNKANGLKEPSAKAAITLMRYPDIIPQDKAFYQAGTAAKECGNTNMAFMLLNK